MKSFWTCLLGACVATAMLSAQSDLRRRPTPAPAYTLGPGDAIQIYVEDLDNLPATSIVIDPSGTVDLPLAGRVQAAGLTLAEFKAELGDKLKKYITNPRVSANLVQSGSEPVSVLGEVNQPGVHQLSGDKRLLEVISLSGGLKQDAGPSVLVTREARWGSLDTPDVRRDPVSGSTTATFSLDALMTSRAPGENILLKPDDVVSIPRSELVYVVGDVQKAGGFQLSTHPTVSLLQALALAQGLGPDNSAKHARILRQVPGGDGTPREIPVDVEKIFAGKAPDIPLVANDVLFIPHSGLKVITRRTIEAAVGVASGILIYR